MRTRTFKVTYVDNMSNGTMNETYYAGHENTTKEYVINFFGLRNSDVKSFKVEEISPVEIRMSHYHTFGELLEKTYCLYTDADMWERLDGSYELWYFPYSDEEITPENLNDAIKAYRAEWKTPISVKVRDLGNVYELTIINANTNQTIITQDYICYDD